MSVISSETNFVHLILDFTIPRLYPAPAPVLSLISTNNLFKQFTQANVKNFYLTA